MALLGRMSRSGQNTTQQWAPSATRGVDADAPRSFYRAGGKRMLDIAAVVLTAVITLPLIGLLALCVALDGANPFYWQHRVGRGGRAFRMLKLRTMIPDADRVLGELLENDPAAAEEWRTQQKLRRDPRITSMGRFLRRSSLDELPQLWNVLIGDMSLVGPRPFMAHQQEIYTGTLYHRMRPGITGLWQVSARNEGFKCREDYDDEYYGRMSFRLDLVTLLRTVFVVARGTGW